MSTEDAKQKMLRAMGEKEAAYAKNFVTFALPRQQPQPIMDKHTHVPSINNDGLFMNLAKCFMNLFLFLTFSPQDSPIIF